MTARKLTPDEIYLGLAATRYQQLINALQRLTEAAGDLDAAIDGTTDQFDAERKSLQDAIDQAQQAIIGLKRGGS